MLLDSPEAVMTDWTGGPEPEHNRELNSDWGPDEVRDAAERGSREPDHRVNIPETA